MDYHKTLFDIKVIFEEPTQRENSTMARENLQGQSNKPQVKVEYKQQKSVDPLRDEKIELIESFSIEPCLNYRILGRRKPIIFQKLLQQLELETNLSFKKRQISLQLSKHQMKINYGNYPLNENDLIQPYNYYDLKEITILAKMSGEIRIPEKIEQKPKTNASEEEVPDLNKKGMSLFRSFVLSEVKEPYSDELEYEAQVKKMKEVLKNKGKIKTEKSEQGRRLNQRRIGYVINKVVAWTKWAARFRHKWLQVNPTQMRKYQPQLSLQDAASVVGIPKKTLDDYYFHIDFAERFRFNFNEHCMDRFAVLRMFVSKFKKESKINLMIQNLAKKKRDSVKKLSKKKRKLLEKERQRSINWEIDLDEDDEDMNEDEDEE